MLAFGSRPLWSFSYKALRGKKFGHTWSRELEGMDIQLKMWIMPICHSFWISKLTLNWTQCHRIPQSSHLCANSTLLEWPSPLWSDSQKSSTFLVLSLSLNTFHSFDFLKVNGEGYLSSPFSPTGLPAFKISSSGPNSCGELQAALQAGPKNWWCVGCEWNGS